MRTNLKQKGATVIIAPDVAAIPALTENSTTIGGSNDGNLPLLTATAPAVTDSTGGAADTSAPIALAAVTAPDLASWDGATVFPSAAQATAIDAAITALKNNQATQSDGYDAILADNVALRAAVREVAAGLNTALAALRTHGLIAS